MRFDTAGRVLRSKSVGVGLVLAGLLLAGCAGEQRQSGFLGDYSQLAPSPALEGALSYENPARPLAGYERFLIEPVRVRFAPGADGTDVDPATLAMLTGYFREEAIRALSQRYQVVARPGPGVLRLRAALTDVTKAKPLLNIHPASKLSGVGLGGAAMEAEAVDAVSGERVLAVVDRGRGNRLALAEGLDDWAHAKAVMSHWVQRFVKRVDAAHGHVTP